MIHNFQDGLILCLKCLGWPDYSCNMNFPPFLKLISLLNSVLQMVTAFWKVRTRLRQLHWKQDCATRCVQNQLQSYSFESLIAIWIFPKSFVSGIFQINIIYSIKKLGNWLLKPNSLRKVFYVKTKNWYRCSEIFGSASSSNPNIGLLKPNFKPHLSSI